MRRNKQPCQRLVRRKRRMRRGLPSIAILEATMYRFKSGQFEDMILEQVMLRNAPDLYRMVDWAERKTILQDMRDDFDKLRKRLTRARIHEHCCHPRCGKTASWLTLARFYRGGWLPHPYYWCDKHRPSEPDGISNKLPIHFDTIKALRDKRGQRTIHKRLREALGISKGTRITEQFARRFFAKLR
jgi:hypothetical protein